MGELEIRSSLSPREITVHIGFSVERSASYKFNFCSHPEALYFDLDWKFADDLVTSGHEIFA